MIEVEHIAKYFGAFPAVRDVSFHVRKGEILGFLGPNGAGKTTTMRILTGFYPPTSGSAKVAGRDVFENSLEVRRKIGYLPESVPLYGDMAVRDYLNFVSEIKGVDRGKRRGAVGRAMEACQLDDVAGRVIKKLSKGYRQRVGLAQALVGDPDILILDEPTIGLDPKQIKEIRNLIKSFVGEKTIILSTHILPEVSMTCQRVVIISEGRVLAEDTPQNLSARLAGANKLRLRVAGPPDDVHRRLGDVAGVLGLTRLTEPGGEDGLGAWIVDAEASVAPQIAAAVCSAGWNLFELTPLTASLEDVFLRLVTKEEAVQDA